MNALQQLFRHHRWANLTLLDFCVGLSAEQLASRGPGAPYGAYGCLVHAVQGEERYYRHITGEDFGYASIDWEHLPPVGQIRARAETVGERYIALAADFAADRAVTVEWEGEMRAMPAYVPLLQCIQHSAEHREQAKAGLTAAGLEPPDTQVWEWEAAGRP